MDRTKASKAEAPRTWQTNLVHQTRAPARSQDRWEKAAGPMAPDEVSCRPARTKPAPRSPQSGLGIAVATTGCHRPRRWYGDGRRVICIIRSPSIGRGSRRGPQLPKDPPEGFTEGQAWRCLDPEVASGAVMAARRPETQEARSCFRSLSQDREERSLSFYRSVLAFGADAQIALPACPRPPACGHSSPRALYPSGSEPLRSRLRLNLPRYGVPCGTLFSSSTPRMGTYSITDFPRPFPPCLSQPLTVCIIVCLKGRKRRCARPGGYHASSSDLLQAGSACVQADTTSL